MIQLLQFEYSLNNTHKLQGMINDLEQSIDVMNKFNEKNGHENISSGKFVLNCRSLKIMTTDLHGDYWPSYPRFMKVILPSILQYQIEAFKLFLETKFLQRKPMMILSQGSLEMQCILLDQTKIMTMTPLQAIVLLVFNKDALGGDASYISFEDIQKYTMIDIEALKIVLRSLTSTKFPILRKNIQTPNILESDSFCVNTELR